MQRLPWIVALAAVVLLVIVLAVWAFKLRKSRTIAPLPKEWSLAARSVFSTEERRVYRLLREALPHHVVLSKLPLVRFCQPTNPNEVRYWFELLGSNHVTFAVCSANGRVLAAIDLDTDRGLSNRAQQIKYAVLNACRVRYLRCPVQHLPSVAELQLLVPQGAASARGPLPAPSVPPAPHTLNQARDTLSSTVATKRAARTALWQDSSVFQDSFFAPDNRANGFANSDFHDTPTAIPREAPGSAGAGGAHDIVGVVVDRPKLPADGRR